MSLFKVRDIWSLNLDELQQHTSNAQSPVSRGDTECKAQFIAHIGRFGSIGSQDVFVCGDLRGFIYIIQVPDSDQRKYIKNSAHTTNHERPQTSASSSSSGSAKQTSQDRNQSPSSDLDERQILAATNLGMPLVDLKCGFFTSALKQSIAVLTFSKLTILQVKRHQVDLISTPNSVNSNLGATTSAIDENLLSHEFEVYVKLDLLPNQFAYSLLVLNSHAESSLVDLEGQQQNLVETDLDTSQLDAKQRNDSSRANGDSKFKRRSKQVVQQLHLPQRDKIIVQYVDQFVFSLVEGKRITGHFNLKPYEQSVASDDRAQGESNQQELKISRMNHAVGCMPMAHVVANKASSLVVSLSDFSLHSLQLDKLTVQAKQNVMKRVALNLLGTKTESRGGKPSALAQGSTTILEQTGQLDSSCEGPIDVDLVAISDWSRELMNLPLQVHGLSRKPRPIHGKDSPDLIGQLLVMSRYSLDLFSSSGEHLWSQRFETPLICLHSYTTDEPDTPRENDQLRANNSKRRFSDTIVSLLCADSLCENKSNLIIMSDDQIGWSALLNSRPLQVMRMNLSRMPGLLATLDLAANQIIVSYLGTNSDSDEPSPQDETKNDAQGLIELERLSEPLFDEPSKRNLTDPSRALEDDMRKRLHVQNSLEMGSVDGTVNVCTSIQLDLNSTGLVIHNIVITIEYDEQLRCDSDRPNVTYPARGVAQILLGSCWPDRREPIKLNTTFSLLSTPTAKSIGTNAINHMNGLDNPNHCTGGIHNGDHKLILPRSLRINLQFDFNETHSGSLHQEQDFLLPINMIAKLAHIDYSSGQGQVLEDVLNNLNQYKGVDGSGPSLHCDLFLKLKCDLMTLLGEIIEADLVCRYRPARSNMGARDLHAARKVETLEDINLLAQSLDCRLRFMSPTPGLTRQSSEDVSLPVMVSFSLKLQKNNLTSFTSSDPERADEQIVWIHICDLSHANRSEIVENFAKQHARNWKKYNGDKWDTPKGTTESNQEPENVALISIESDQPLPLVLVLDHLIERVHHMTVVDARCGTEIVSTMSGALAEFFNNSGQSNQVAISSKLHDLLLSLMAAHNAGHRNTMKKLQDELSREYSQFQAATEESLSLAKRMPSLPDEMRNQLSDSMLQVKKSHQKLIDILDELGRLKKRDYEYSRLPRAGAVKIEHPKTLNCVSWSGFEQISY